MSVIPESLSQGAVSTVAEITFLPDERTIAVDSATNLLSAARQAGVQIDAPCGERGHCGKCRVQIISGEVSALTGEEEALLKPEEVARGLRLACLTRALGSVVVEIPESSRNLAQRKATAELRRAVTPAPYTRQYCVEVARPSIATHDLRDDLARLREHIPHLAQAELGAVRTLHQALQEGEYRLSALMAGDKLIAVEPGDTGKLLYGVALDIGTTTLVGYLMNLCTGEEVAVCALPNPQASYGADVISRIEFAQASAANVDTLRQSVTTAINTILDTVAAEAGIPTCHIYELVVVGNTCMSHLFLGIDPVSLGYAPYTPVITDAMSVAAVELGVSMHPHGLVRTLPNIAGFVGADTVGVLAASDIEHCKGLHVAVDIGTNAEVMVGIDGRLIACSTAAGPAFEGAKISQGMRAQPGAIDGLTIGQDIFVHTIGNQPPLGICGSGIIDAIGELRRAGMLEASGRLADPEDLPHLPVALRERITGDGIVLVWAGQSGADGDIVLTQRDIREVQLVKAAIYAGIVTLLDKIGHTPDELDSLHIAGAFGTYITKEHALAIGLIPNIPLHKLVFLGNAAGTGAKMALISHPEYTAICASARRVEYVELAGDENFRDNFSMAMMLAPGCDEE